MSAEVIGIMSGLLGLLSVVPYAVRTWQHKINPNPTSWFLWSLLSAVLLLTYKEAGAEASIWLAVAGALNVLIVFVLALVRQRNAWNRPDTLEVVALVMGMISIGYLIFGQAGSALYIAIFADMWAVAPTIRGAWRRPSQDRPFAWIMFATASVLSMFAVTNSTVSNYALPIYYSVTELLVAVPLVMYRRSKKIPLREWV